MTADRNETALTTLSLQETSAAESPVFSTNGTTDSRHNPTPAPVTEFLDSVNSSVTETVTDYVGLCPSNVACHRLGADCILCDFNTSCRYGHNVSVTCHVKPLVNCTVNGSDVELDNYSRLLFLIKGHSLIFDNS